MHWMGSSNGLELPSAFSWYGSWFFLLYMKSFPDYPTTVWIRGICTKPGQYLSMNHLKN
jgi:hypothetical protein